MKNVVPDIPASEYDFRRKMQGVCMVAADRKDGFFAFFFVFFFEGNMAATTGSTMDF